jgi:hypothetical protein
MLYKTSSTFNLKPLAASLLLIALGSNIAFAQEINISLKADPGLSWMMANPYRGVAEELTLLKAQKSGQLPENSLILGASANALATYDKNTGPKSPWVDESRFSVPQASISTTYAWNKSIVAYLEAGAQNIGAKESENSAAGQMSIKNAYVLVHQNLNNSSATIYEFAGNKDIDFGDFSNKVNIDVYNLANLADLYFKAHGNTFGMGYQNNGFNSTVSVMNGGSEGDTSRLYTRTANNITNAAVNLSYGKATTALAWKVGVGYLNGSSIDFAKKEQQPNPAYDLNAKLDIQQVSLLAEYVTTLYDTTETNNKAVAFVTGMSYHFLWSNKATLLGLQYSMAKNAQFQGIKTVNQTQTTYSLELNHEAIKNVWVGAQLEHANNIVGVNGVKEYAFQLMSTIVF